MEFMDVNWTLIIIVVLVLIVLKTWVEYLAQRPPKVVTIYKAEFGGSTRHNITHNYITLRDSDGEVVADSEPHTVGDPVIFKYEGVEYYCPAVITREVYHRILRDGEPR